MCQIGIGQMIKEFDFKFCCFVLRLSALLLRLCSVSYKIVAAKKIIEEIMNQLNDGLFQTHTLFTLSHSYAILSKEPTKRKMIFGTKFPSLEFNPFMIIHYCKCSATTLCPMSHNPLYDHLQMNRWHCEKNTEIFSPDCVNLSGFRKKKKNNCRQRNFCVKLCVSHAIEYMIWHHPICACVCLCVSHVVSHNWRANKWKKHNNDGDSNDKKKFNYIYVWNEIEVVVRYIYWVSTIQIKKTQTHSHTHPHTKWTKWMQTRQRHRTTEPKIQIKWNGE